MSGAPSAARFGHTGITWPFTPEGHCQAIVDVAAAGFAGIELFAPVVSRYPGGVGSLGAELDAAGLAYAASYAPIPLVDSPEARASIASYARDVRALGGDVLVVGFDPGPAGDRDRERDHARLLDDATAIAGDAGVRLCFHPHSGTPVATESELSRLLDDVRSEEVYLAPDTGQFAKVGDDPVAVVQRYLPRIRHVHLKDYVGGESKVEWPGGPEDRTGFLDYTPLGGGAVDLRRVLTALQDYDGWLMVELDGTDRAPIPPREAAEQSAQWLHAYLEEEER